MTKSTVLAQRVIKDLSPELMANASEQELIGQIRSEIEHIHLDIEKIKLHTWRAGKLLYEARELVQQRKQSFDAWLIANRDAIGVTKTTVHNWINAYKAVSSEEDVVHIDDTILLTLGNIQEEYREEATKVVLDASKKEKLDNRRVKGLIRSLGIPDKKGKSRGKTLLVPQIQLELGGWLKSLYGEASDSDVINALWRKMLFKIIDEENGKADRQDFCKSRKDCRMLHGDIIKAAQRILAILPSPDGIVGIQGTDKLIGIVRSQPAMRKPEEHIIYSPTYSGVQDDKVYEFLDDLFERGEVPVNAQYSLELKWWIPSKG